MMSVMTTAVMALSLAAAPAGKLGGTYASPIGEVTFKKKGKSVVATMAQAGGPCAFKKGQQVLKGNLLDDSVTGTMSICSKGKGCGIQKLFVVLLVARGCDLLSGAVQHKGNCALPLEGKGVAFAKSAGAGKKLPPKAAREVEAEKPAPAPEPEPAEEEPAAVPVTADEVERPFAQWNPETVEHAVEGGRTKAIGLGRDAEALLNRGKFDEARPLLMQALRADPAYAEGYNMMGVTFYARDKHDDALDWYKKALTVNPDFGDAYYNIACIYALEGKNPLALRYLRIALLNGYREVKAMEGDADLDGIRKDGEYIKLIEEVVQSGKSAEPAPEQSDAGAAVTTDAGAVPADPVAPDAGSEPSPPSSPPPAPPH